MGRASIRQLRAVLRQGMSWRRADEGLRALRRDIRGLKRETREAWQNRNIRLGVELNEKLAALRRVEQEHLGRNV